MTHTRLAIGPPSAPTPRCLSHGCPELSRVKGSELVGMKYKPMFDYFADRETSFVVCEDNYVTNESGTGIVHQVRLRKPGAGSVMVCDVCDFSGNLKHVAFSYIKTPGKPSGLPMPVRATGVLPPSREALYLRARCCFPSRIGHRPQALVSPVGGIFFRDKSWRPSRPPAFTLIRCPV